MRLNKTKMFKNDCNCTGIICDCVNVVPYIPNDNGWKITELF
jgi:hypothetical protein